MQKIDRFIAACFIWLIIQIRPFLGPSKICPFYLGCTEFALIQLETHNTPYAILHIGIRLLKCNPFWIWLQHHEN